MGARPKAMGWSHEARSYLQSLGGQLCEGNYTPIYFLPVHPIHKSIGVGAVMVVPLEEQG